MEHRADQRVRDLKKDKRARKLMREVGYTAQCLGVMQALGESCIEIPTSGVLLFVLVCLLPELNGEF